MNQYVKQYQKSSIETASKEQILIMLYDGAIQFLNKAKTDMLNKDVESAHNNLIAAQRIIQEFIDSMDREVAPQLAQNLISLYDYFIRRLVHANVKRQVAPIEEVLSYLKSLKATWEKAIILAQKEQEQNSIDSYKSVNVSDADDEEDDDDNDDYDEEDDEDDDEDEE